MPISQGLGAVYWGMRRKLEYLTIEWWWDFLGGLEETRRSKGSDRRPTDRVYSN